MPVADREFLAFIEAVIAGDRAKVARHIKEDATLVTRAAIVGASRASSRDYFFKEILHYLNAGDTALHMAAAAFQPAMVKLLIQHGADVRARNRHGTEPLHYACDGVPCSAHWNPKAQAAVIKLLIKAGADPNAFNKLGVAPLHRAVRNRCAAAVKTLLAGGANPKLKNKSESTPSKLAEMTTGRGGSGSDAAKQEQLQIVRLLEQASL